MRRKEEEADKNNELYAGGVDNRGGGSGLAVQNPGDSVPGAGGHDVFRRIMDKAQEGGSEYSGDGPVDGKLQHKIKMYKNGFVVNDGPFRASEDPANRLFLEQLAKGYVPAELMEPSSQPPGGLRSSRPAVDVGVEDHRDEDYVPPAYVAYGGEGMTLASSSSVSSEGSVVDPAAVGPAPQVDPALPTTTIQVKLLSGKKIRVKLNTASSVAQLCACIARDGGGEGRYVLSSGFPPKDLTLSSLDTSITDAGLQGASITMKAV